MMEKAIKQRLLGGLVLVAGAILFLPVLFDGSGAGLTIPPLPAAPEVASVEAMAPQLEQKVVEADQAIDAAHAGREDAPAVEGDVAPDAAAQAAGEGAPVAATAAAATAIVTAAAAARAPAPAPAARPVPPSVPTLAKPSSPAPVPTASPRPAAPVPAKPLAAAPVQAKPVAPAVVAKPASAAVPGAWVVQVASLSSREQAQKLVQQLRGKGYPAVLNPQGDKWKVMVGPELNRAVADSIKNRLAADPELRLNGWVQAYKP